MPRSEDDAISDDSILERVARLEGRLDTEQRSLTRKFGQWIALLALVISIAVGVFQVYENIVIRERESVAEDRRTLAGYIQQITALNSRIVSAYFSTSDKTASHALAKILNVEKSSILGLADNLLLERKGIASYASLFTLSTEHLNWGNSKQARKYAESALSLANTNVERVEAKRILARTWFAPGNTQSVAHAREIFGSAVETIEAMEVLGRSSLFANVYSDWVGAEVAFGDCNLAKDAWNSFAEAIKHDYDGMQILSATKAQLAATLGNFEACQIF